MLLDGMRIYTVTFTNTLDPANGDCDIVSILPGAGRSIVPISCKLSVTSELAEAADEALDIRLKRGATTQGSGGSTATPVPAREGNGISTTAVVHTFDTTPSSAGTEVELDAFAPPQRNEYRYQPIPAEFLEIENPSILCVRYPHASNLQIADTIRIVGTLIYGESD